MNKAMVTIGIILMFILGVVAINLITSQQTGQELDYYLLKDTTEAAMQDSMMTLDFYGETGLNRMDKERFVESFIRRFADSVDATLNKINQLKEVTKEGTWSQYERAVETKLYL